MRAVILGSGSASGVPAVSTGWGACDPNNPRNRRRRPSILVEDAGTRILVDTSPDLRSQLLDAGVNALDGVVYTHGHADHLHGIDDLREINRAMGRSLATHASREVLASIGERFPYILEPLAFGATNFYKPVLDFHEIDGPFRVGNIDVTPFDQDHGYSRTVGLRFGPLAYTTDAVDMPEDSFEALAGIRIWIIGCLTDHPHPTHAHLDKALGWIARVRPERAYITHMGTRLDYDAVKAQLPPHVEPAYDGMVIDA